MSNINDGGPDGAGDRWPDWDVGMSLRDYFAAKVLPNIYSTAMVDAADGSGLFSDPDWRMGLALDAYAMADAMLAARAAKANG